VRAGLDALGVAHRIEPRLVRGLDYYTRTTFEFAGLALAAAQNAIGGGGRYDGLAEAIGGEPTPGIGFGIGIERLLMACDAEGCFAVDPPAADAFVMDITRGDGAGSHARNLVDELRRAGLVALRAYDGRSPKSQMKQADKSGARFAVIIGDEELANGVVTVRPLRREGDRDGDRNGEQETVKRQELVTRLREG
jgi:histidyl-tRNA synthetase